MIQRDQAVSCTQQDVRLYRVRNKTQAVSCRQQNVRLYRLRSKTFGVIVYVARRSVVSFMFLLSCLVIYYKQSSLKLQKARLCQLSIPTGPTHQTPLIYLFLCLERHKWTTVVLNVPSHEPERALTDTVEQGLPLATSYFLELKVESAIPTKSQAQVDPFAVSVACPLALV